MKKNQWANHQQKAKPGGVPYSPINHMSRQPKLAQTKNHYQSIAANKLIQISFYW
jgi:hypothetical protein